jgi:hypothetical protein
VAGVISTGTDIQGGSTVRIKRSISATAAVIMTAAVTLTACKPTGGVNTTPDSSGVTTSIGTSTGGGTGAAVDQHTGAASTPSSPAKPAAARLGQPITISGNEDGSKIQVTAVKYAATAHSTDDFSTPDKGKKYVAVQFRLRNVGTAAYDDSPSNGAKVIDTQDQQFDATFMVSDISAGPLLPSYTKIAPGGSALGYLVFEVPVASKIAKVQFSMDSGLAEAAEWII